MSSENLWRSPLQPPRGFEPLGRELTRSHPHHAGGLSALYHEEKRYPVGESADSHLLRRRDANEVEPLPQGYARGIRDGHFMRGILSIHDAHLRVPSIERSGEFNEEIGDEVRLHFLCGSFNYRGKAIHQADKI